VLPGIGVLAKLAGGQRAGGRSSRAGRRVGGSGGPARPDVTPGRPARTGDAAPGATSRSGGFRGRASRPPRWPEIGQRVSRALLSPIARDTSEPAPAEMTGCRWPSGKGNGGSANQWRERFGQAQCNEKDSAN